MQTPDYDAVIAGGGAAGLSAALMLGRSRRSVLVVDDGSPRNRFADHMHGVLGHEGTSPADLVRTGRAEAARYGVSFSPGRVTDAEDAGGEATPDDGVPPELIVHLSDGRVVTTRALVAASGITDDLPEIPGLAERWGRTVLHCPYCHGWEVRDARLGVVATSPLSVHQAEMIRQWSPHVTVFSAGLGPLAPQTSQRLRARGIVLEPSPVVEVRGEGEAVSAVVLADGREVVVDAIFTSGRPLPHDSYLDRLGLERTDGPFGSFLTVDAAGRTSHPRIWAAGNVVNPMANVPISTGAGAMAGAAANGALVGWEFDAAAPPVAAWWENPSAEDWEQRYAGADGVWSGSPNRVLADVAAGLTPGSALDIGCGEGADAVWLASTGWRATGVDVSATAVTRAQAAAEERGLGADRARFIAGDLGAVDGETFDLVTASFLHSPAGAPREEVLRAAADRVAPGGHLLLTSHYSMPGRDGGDGAGDGAGDDEGHGRGQRGEHDGDGTGHAHGHGHDGQRFLTPDEELQALDLPADRWTTVIAEIRPREATMPDGSSATLEDAVLLLRRA